MNEMTQHPLRFGADDALFGLLTEPLGQSPEPVACLMLNMGANHRVGPHRVNVKLAHILARQGVASLRFDLGGIGDSDSRQSPSGLKTWAVRDLQAGMDAIEQALGIRQFIIAGLCSGVEHAMTTAAVDTRVVGLSLFDGFAFPGRRSRLERTAWRAWAVLTHPAFVGKTRRWLLEHALRRTPQAPLPGFFTDAVPAAVTADWFASTMKLLSDRSVAVQLLFSGSLHVRDHGRDQLGAFVDAPFARSLSYQFMGDVDHTMCTVQGQQRYLQAVSEWVRYQRKPQGAEQRVRVPSATRDPQIPFSPVSP